MPKRKFMHPERRAKRIARRQKIGRGIRKVASNPVVQKAVLTGAKQLASGGFSKQNLKDAALSAANTTHRGSQAITAGKTVKALMGR